MRLDDLAQQGRSRTIVALGLVMALAVTLVSGGLIAWRHDEVVRKAEADLTNVSTLLATQSFQAFQVIDVIQDQLVARLAGANTPADLKAMAGAPGLHDELARIARSVDVLDALAIIDDRGQLLNFSREWPIPNLSVADRDYFRALSVARTPTYWSAPVRNRSNGALTVYSARRFDFPNGRMAGLVLGMVSVDQLRRYFASIVLPRSSSIALARADGVLLVQSSMAQGGEGRLSDSVTAVSRTLDDMDASHTVFLRGRNGQELVTAVRKIPGYPLVIAISAPWQSILKSWRQEALTIGFLALVLDVTIGVAGLLGLRQIRASERAFRAQQYAARHDILTGLPNRSFFKERLDDMLCARKRRFTAFTLLLIDLDRFKEINDSLGHATGDHALKAVSERWRQVIGANDFLARLGGDEFAVVHPHHDEDRREVSVLAEKLQMSLAGPIRLADADVKIACSIGTAIARSVAEEPAQLLAHADLALFKAKEDGRNAVHAYTDDIGIARKERLSMLRDLRAAVDNRQLNLFFQPIVDLKGRRIVAFEALLRWKDPVRGYVSPARFIPLAEDSGLIARIGNWVLNEACREAATWPGAFKVCVNLSPVQLRMGDVFAETYAALNASGLPAKRLMLEITESVQLDQADAGQTLRNLRNLGVGVALDDFGTGYASLSYLQSFPFDVIKIDQSFVRDMHRSTQSQVIVQTVLAMGERLGMGVTAEGVETIEQLEALRQQGCATVQGYLFGAPMAAEAVAGFVHTWRYPNLDSVPKLLLVS